MKKRVLIVQESVSPANNTYAQLIGLYQLSCSSVTNFCVRSPNDFSNRDDSAPPAEDSDFIMAAAADDDDGNASATAAA